MLVLQKGSSTAMVVLHEIYGINTHITDVCEQYSSIGYDVYCPNLLGAKPAFDYADSEEAYTHFNTHVGFVDPVPKIVALIESLRPQYDRLICLGFSVGATLGWLAAAQFPMDALIGLYGSRIRNYLTLIPMCPSLLVFAEHEEAFVPKKIAEVLSGTPQVSVRILEGKHGFCNPFADTYHPASASEVTLLINKFLSTLQHN